eukprot:2069692-Pyramimonas_sp.AAC.1
MRHAVRDNFRTYYGMCPSHFVRWWSSVDKVSNYSASSRQQPTQLYFGGFHIRKVVQAKHLFFIIYRIIAHCAMRQLEIGPSRRRRLCAPEDAEARALNSPNKESPYIAYTS